MKARFSSLSRREQVLLLVLASLTSSTWLLYAAKRSKRMEQAFAITRAREAEQAVWLGHRGEIERKVAQVTSALVPAQTLAGNQLFAEVSRMLKGLTSDIGNQKTEGAGGVVIHSVEVRIQKVSLGELGHFYDGLVARSPYLGLEMCELVVDPTGTGNIDARMTIYAIEIPAPGVSPKA
jgi:hypothetical protein